MLSSLNDFYNLVYQVEYTELCIYTDRLLIFVLCVTVFFVIRHAPLPNSKLGTTLYGFIIICSPAGGL